MAKEKNMAMVVGSVAVIVLGKFLPSMIGPAPADIMVALGGVGLVLTIVKMLMK